LKKDEEDIIGKQKQLKKAKQDYTSLQKQLKTQLKGLQVCGAAPGSPPEKLGGVNSTLILNKTAKPYPL